MEWLMIIGFVAIGLILIIIEIIFVPGTTIVGIGGFICMGYGIFVAFENFGTSTGLATLAVAAVISIGTLVYAFKTNAWERFSLKETMQGKFNEDFKFELEVGDEGETLSSLKPIGKALIKEHELEVRSSGNFIGEKQKIKVIKIDNNKIFVEPLT